jgi:hypothetical protein
VAVLVAVLLGVGGSGGCVWVAVAGSGLLLSPVGKLQAKIKVPNTNMIIKICRLGLAFILFMAPPPFLNGLN